jgi:polysaccharide biosynthesis protein PslH
MRILWVKANKLLPVHSGGDIRSYHLARYLASRHDLTFLSYYDGKPDPVYEAALSKEFPGAQAIYSGKRDLTTFRRGADYLKSLPQAEPYAVSRLICSEAQRQIREGFKQSRFDVAVCDFLDAAINFPDQLTVPSVLFQHNVESEIWRRYYLTEKNPVKRTMFRLEFKRMLAYEQKTLPKFKSVIAVSAHDRELMSNWVDASKITVVPTGVDLQQYRPAKRLTDAKPLVMYVGAMDWPPNVDAIEYFCSTIWPEVRTKVPEAKFRIVGRNPNARIRSLASDSIEVTGSVPSVVEHLRDAAVVVVPLRIGGGTRLKIYEAMAMGKAVVSTSVGAEGLDVHHGRDIMLVDEPNKFADAVVALLKERDLRERIENAAAELAAKYDWPVIGEKFAQVLESAAGASHAAARYVPAAGGRIA